MQLQLRSWTHHLCYHLLQILLFLVESQLKILPDEPGFNVGKLCQGPHLKCFFLVALLKFIDEEAEILLHKD
jgi:hypothetical protein